MQLSWRPSRRGEIEHGIIFGAMAIALLAAARVLPLTHILPNCLFRELVGLPCPTCGTTRSLTGLARGDLAAAMSLNPLAAAVLLLAVIAFLFNAALLLFRLPRPSLIVGEDDGRRLRVAVAVIVLLNWAYLLSVQR